MTVWVLDIDEQRKRVGLTMIKPGTEPPAKTTQPTKTQQTDQRKPAALSTSKQASSRKTPAKKPSPTKSPRPKKKPEPPLPEVEEGQTLRGFDELKALWKQNEK